MEMAMEPNTFTSEFEAFIAERIQSGRYANKGEVLSALRSTLEREERYQEKLTDLRQAIADGEASGIAEGDVIARVRARAGLPQRTSV
jgi:antitoxin ParD1/3/4